MHLSRLAEAHPEKDAVVQSADGAVLTYAELDRRSRDVARLLARHGIGARDHVAILMDNRADYLVVAWAAQRSGIYYTPVNWHLTEDEAAYVVSDCGARALFASAGVAPLAAAVARRVDGLELLAMAGQPEAGWAAMSSAAELAGQAADPPEVEGTYFFYSSGTTGMPKGIQPAHEFPPFGAGLAIDHVMGTAFGIDERSVYLCPAPLYHASPLGWSLGTQRHGGTVVLMERFDPLECLQAIERYGVTHAQFVPTMFVRMLKLPEAQRRAYDLSSLRMVVHAAAPCPPDVKAAMIDWLGPKLMEFYAGSEGSGMTIITSEEWLTHRGSVGKAALGVLHILDEDGEALPPGEIGTVWFEGGGSFRYHNDAEKTAGAHNAQGWSTLGDMGHLDEEGYLYLAARRTDLIITGGVNVYPQEIENALVMHPAVADVAVIGVPDPEMGQTIRAVVQTAPGVTADDALGEVLMEHWRSRLPGFKRPRSLVFVPELPRLPNGKLLRRRVREEHGDVEA
ncbi:MAG: fadD [Frankiales bacterium]|nr:fadD [Frankiales bacterium]